MTINKDELKRRFSGQLLFPDDPDYEEARVGRLFNRRRPKRYPAAILLAESEQDLVNGVLLAREQGWKIAVRGGGHSWAVWSVRDGVLLIDPVRYKEYSYDPQTGIVVATASVKGGEELNPYLARFGRFFCGGHYPTVGIGGYLLQGGQGWNARGWGWSVEYIEAIDVVTADGRVLHCSEKENSDLFWAARGAGHGFFGLVVRYYLRTIPRPQLMQSVYVYPMELFDEVMTWYLNIHGRISKDVELVATSHVPQEHENIPSRKGEPVLTVHGLAMVYDPEEGRKALEPLATCPVLDKALFRREQEPTTMEVQLENQRLHNPEGCRYIADNAWVDGPPERVVPAIRHIFTDLATPHSYSLFFSMAPLRKLPDMAFSLQTEIYIATYAVYEADREDLDRPMREFITNQMRKLEPITVGQYIGDSDFTARQLKFMADENWKRLLDIRDKYDPDRLFIGYMTKDDTTLNQNEWEIGK
jgi:hypothetical protein